MVFPSGLNAIWTALGAFSGSGDHILMIDCAYSPARRICNEELKRFGVEVTFFDPTIGAGISELLKPNTRLIYLESPGFLTMEVVDIAVITEIAHQHGLMVVCDNTWATPLHIKPFELGIDISLHSGTKYISGHSDALLGVLTFKTQHRKALERYAYNVGAATSPDVCYLAQRGLRTIALRLRQHEQSALKVANWLTQHPAVESVLFPALPSDPGHELWKRYYTGACGLFSFVLKKPYPREVLARMLDNMQLCAMGFSWGGFESLLIPIDPRPVRAASKWPYEGQAFRIHVGLEHVDDIIEDLEKGLSRLE
jgi:cystathionine beta-lyase